MSSTRPTTDVRYQRSRGARLRSLLRFGGLTGVLLGSVAGFWLGSLPIAWEANLGQFSENLTAILRGQFGRTAQWVGGVFAGSLLVVVLTLVVETVAGLLGAAGRRSALGANVLFQVALAAGLLIAVNVWSFHHYQRFDLTRDRVFTLPSNIVQEFRQLRSSTTIVVLQQHQTLGRSDRPDRYDYAAERKVVEKVRDLVEQIQEFGPTFQVKVLDVEDDDFDEKLAELGRQSKELENAVRSAPENSIFFYANGRVQRLAFSEFYQLDKLASKEANHGRGNLVLTPRGVEAFARRILAIEERKPRVVVAVAHPLLASREVEGMAEYGQAGLRKALERQGLEVVDMVLRKNWRRNPQTRRIESEATAYSFEESELESQEGLVSFAEVEVQIRQRRIETYQKILADLPRIEAEEQRLGRRYLLPLGNQLLTVEDAKRELPPEIAKAQELLAEAKKKLAEERAKLESLRGNERVIEERRITDVRAKMERLLQTCDLLIIARVTLLNVALPEAVPPELHPLDREQVEVIRDFLKAGKPILVLAGPMNTPEPLADTDPLQPTPSPAATQGVVSDELERLLREVGVDLAPQTVLFEAEAPNFAERRSSRELTTKGRDVPSLRLVGPPPEAKPNPIAEAIRDTARSFSQFEIPVRHPRPVFLVEGWERKLPQSAEFLWTDPAGWNEARPFPGYATFGSMFPGSDPDYVPYYEPSGPEDPYRGTRLAERKGSFPVGVALEVTLPIEWYDANYVGYKGSAALLGMSPLSQSAGGIWSACLTAAALSQKRPSSRVVVIGHGGLFSTPSLSPARERLLQHLCNWLLNRHERLPTTVSDEKKWRYPRIELDDTAFRSWRWGTFVGLPLVFAYLGMVMLMIRRTR